ncbi:MAG: DUF4922 domain-containing protein [Nanoarchaeota archaeon]
MCSQFSPLKQEVLDRWFKAAESYEIPRDAYHPEVKIVSKPGEFSFGVILNNYRFKRYAQREDTCFLCDAVEMSEKESVRNLDPENILKEFRVLPNKYPLLPGTSLAITTKERPMYATNLDDLSRELSDLLEFTNKTGFRLFHNSPGAGASVEGHEHYHLTNFGAAYDIAGEAYGFDKSGSRDIIPLEWNIGGVFKKTSFPFAHVIFHTEHLDGLATFLNNINRELGENFPNKVVPHGLAQVEAGILVVPVKIFEKKGIGSGDMASHLVVKTREEFERADYDFCMGRLSERLYKKGEINLTKFL